MTNITIHTLYSYLPKGPSPEGPDTLFGTNIVFVYVHYRGLLLFAYQPVFHSLFYLLPVIVHTYKELKTGIQPS